MCGNRYPPTTSSQDSISSAGCRVVGWGECVGRGRRGDLRAGDRDGASPARPESNAGSGPPTGLGDHGSGRGGGGGIPVPRPNHTKAKSDAQAGPRSWVGCRSRTGASSPHHAPGLATYAFIKGPHGGLGVWGKRPAHSAVGMGGKIL